MNRLNTFLCLSISLSPSLSALADDHTKDAVARHSTRTDCWIIIDDTIYDISRSMKDHDRYKYQLDSWCGKDASKAWKTKDDRNKPHSRKAHSMLKELRIGRLKQ